MGLSKCGGAESVDVIVPVYRGQRYINGIISQLEACLEGIERELKVGLILVNDAPDDVFREEYVSETIDITVVETDQNRGIHGARVRGLSYCTGSCVVFLDQDDRLSKNYFQSQLASLGSADAVVCRAVNGAREFYDCGRRFEAAVSVQNMFSVGNGILSPGQVLMRREAVPRFWKEHILRKNGADDWMLWLCMLYEGKRFVRNQDILYEHILGSDNCSESAFDMYQSELEMYAVLREHDYLDREYRRQLRQAVQNGTKVRLRELDRLKAAAGIYDLWLEAGAGSVAQVLKRRACHKIAIYGMGKIGLRLYQELRETFEVVCFIDRNAAYIRTDIPVYTMEEAALQADLVIIALTDKENQICSEVTSRLQLPAINIKDILLESKLQLADGDDKKWL